VPGVTQQAAGYEDCDIPLASGRLRVRRWGAAEAAAVLCVPGISANLCGFDRLAERLAGDTLQLVAIDMRGRGRSEMTGAGTYGWRNHARDVLGVADAVGAASFAVIGQSSGAAIAMTCAQLAPSRVQRLVLVDLAGSPDERAGVPIVAAVSRLGTVYPSAQAAIALVRQLGIVPEWDEYWDRYFGYELREVDGGVTASTDKGAVLEDLGYGNAMFWSEPEAPVHALWTAVTVPALVLRATREILPGFGFILVPCQNQRLGLTCCSTLGVHAYPPHLRVHGPGVRLAGTPGAQRCREGCGDTGAAARGRGAAPAGRPAEAGLG
jgi:pimeloyl-ACP methyl ester carboxylesterase